MELVSRTTRRLHPTTAGLDFADRIRPALTTIDGARENLVARDRGLAGTIPASQAWEYDAVGNVRLR